MTNLKYTCPSKECTWTGVEGELSVISDNYFGEWELLHQCPLCETGIDMTDYKTVEENE